MTVRQFARAVGASEKWVQNTARLLGCRFAYTVEEARWLAIVRLLSDELGLSLARAAEAADRALLHDPADRAAALVTSDVDGDAHGIAAVVVDLARHHSDFAARLAHAVVHDPQRRAGRRGATEHRWLSTSRARRHATRTLADAQSHGVDLDLLRSSLARTPTERLALLDENATFLAAARRGRQR